MVTQPSGPVTQTVRRWRGVCVRHLQFSTVSLWNHCTLALAPSASCGQSRRTGQSMVSKAVGRSEMPLLCSSLGRVIPQSLGSLLINCTVHHQLWWNSPPRPGRITGHKVILTASCLNQGVNSPCPSSGLAQISHGGTREEDRWGAGGANCHRNPVHKLRPQKLEMMPQI